VEGIEFECTIGVTERERVIKQKIVVNLRVGADFAEVKESDSIADTVDYREIRRTVATEGEKSSFRLIEALAGHLGRALIETFPRISWVRVELWKPGALTAAKAVGVVVVEGRGQS
jgi:dihydroneopterin aldolase